MNQNIRNLRTYGGLQQCSQKFMAILFLTLTALLSVSCKSLEGSDLAPVDLPSLRVEAGECYYLDDFLPTPNNLVTGKNGGLFLRYYTYKSANYKMWSEREMMLSFYSRDNRCWSLFDESTIGIF